MGATSFIAGLTIRGPEGFEPLPGESFSETLNRWGDQSSIESATSSENNSGSSAPTAENIGQIQTDLGVLEDKVTALEGDRTEITAVSDRVTALEEHPVISGSIAASGTTVTVNFPSNGAWQIVPAAVGNPLPGLYVSTVLQGSATFVWTDAAPVGTSIHYIAKKSA